VAVGKSRSPMVDSRVWWTGSDNVDIDCRQDLNTKVSRIEEFIDQIRWSRSMEAFYYYYY